MRDTGILTVQSIQKPYSCLVQMLALDLPIMNRSVSTLGSLRRW